ncbi:MAG: glycoside hydrolase family 71/99-like protein [Ferruginibacter sp.]
MIKKLIGLILILCSLSCGKKSSGNTAEDGVTVYAPVAVQKTVNKKVFVHIMPWFETPASNNGVWGLHWRMNNKNPNLILPNGQRDIASHYYPLIGPYASGDANVIEYQLLLMKLSGIDGVYIDWPGIQQLNDYPLLVSNTLKIVALLDKVGLNFAIVYEDQNLPAGNAIPTAQADMNYLQNNFFVKSNYEKQNGKPLLLVFGPQKITNAADWNTVFSVLPVSPSFFTLWYESSEAPAAGEFAWVYMNNISDLTGFYSNGYTGIKMGSAYPGFNSYYAPGGWMGPTWVIPHDNGNGDLGTFQQTVDLAISQPSVNYIQLVTWNDYGEGTNIEPTKEFGYGFLTSLQQRLGVAFNEADLEMIAKLYQQRIDKAGDTAIQKKLDQAFYFIVSLRIAEAHSILDTL